MASWGVVVVLAVATGGWALSLLRRNATVVDRLWGLLFVALACTYLGTGSTLTGRCYLASVLVSVWGLRLCAYLTWRDWGHGEDWRHRQLRNRSSHFALRSLLELFWFQSLGAVVVATPLLAAVRKGQPASLGWLDGLGTLVWASGFLLEATADRQLTRFRADPDRRGAVLDTGVWRYSRHPNYFGDAVMWCGLGLIGLAAGAWWALVGPAVMLAILLRFSGLAVMEPYLQATRGTAHAEYVRRTSAFVPRRPKRPRVASLA